MSAAEAQDEAQRFARYQIHAGKGAAALQRPADPAGYAAGVDQYLNRARALLAQYGAGGAASPQQTTSLPTTTTTPTNIPAPPQVALNLPPTAFNQGLQNLQGVANMLGARTHTSVASIPMPTPPSFPKPVVPPAPTSTVDIPLNQPGHPNETTAGPTGTRVVQLARQYLGTPYQWGGESPRTGFDCSGFAQWLYAQQGVKLPRVAADQFNVGQHVDLKHLQPGDLVFFRDASGIHHEGIAIGSGQFIHAPHTGDVVKISSLSDPYYARQFAGGRRVG
jgi:cell wall-associated NlpC family hydrolase